jgi:membrane protein
MDGGLGFFWGLLALSKEAFSEWKKDNASLLAAALAYYAIFSLAPLVIIVLAISGLFFGPEASRGILEARVSSFLGSEVAHIIQEVIRNAGNPSTSIFATVAALIFFFFGATGLFMQAKRGLNIIWGVQPQHGAVTNILWSYLLSFIQMLVVGFILLLSTLLTALLSSASRYFRDLLPLNFTILHLLNFSIFFIMVFLLFASAYKALSGVSLLWTDVIYGSGFTALLFVVGNLLIQIYVSAADLGSVYGAASSLIVVLFWVYYSSQTFFYGAEYIKVYARKYGSHSKT